MSRMGEYALELQEQEMLDGPYIENEPEYETDLGLQPPVSAEFSGDTPWVSLHQTAAAATSSASLKASTSDAATA